MTLSNQRYCICLLVGVTFILTARSQPAAPDTSLNVPIREYHSYLTPESGLYRGPEYIVYAHLLKEGHPYFGQGQAHQGSILYSGVLYTNVSILFDLVKQTVVISDARGIFRIGLIWENVDSFTIQNNSFINNRDSIHTNLRPGYYQLLHQGRLTILKREKKTIRSQIDYLTVNQYIDYSVDYYLKKDGDWITVNSERALLHAMGADRQALKKFLRSNGLKFKKNKDNTLLRSADWYENQHQ